MVVFIGQHGAVGVSSLERNGLLTANSFPNHSSACVSRRPLLGVALSASKGVDIIRARTPNFVKTSALPEEHTRNPLVVGAAILNEELEFRPSFDEYLKVLQTVRGRREKRRHLLTSKGHPPKNGVHEEDEISRNLKRSRDGVQEKDEGSAKFGRSTTGVRGKDKVDSTLEKLNKGMEIRDKGNSMFGMSKDGVRVKDSKYANAGRTKEGVYKQDNDNIHRLRMVNDDLRGGHKDVFKSGKHAGHRNQERRSRTLGQSVPFQNAVGRNTERTLERDGLQDLKKRNLWEKYNSILPAGIARDAVRGKFNGKERNTEVNVKLNVLQETNDGRQLKHPSSISGTKLDSRWNMHDFFLNKTMSSDGELVQERGHTQNKIYASKQAASMKGHATMRVNDFDMATERAAFKNFDEFSDVVDKPRASRGEMEDRIQKLAKCLNGADINMPEWMFSKMMRSAEIIFTDHSILRVIQLLGKLGNWRRVLQVIEWMQARERFKSYRIRYIYTTALNVLQKARRPVEALNVFHSMQQHMSSYPDLVAYRCIAVTLGQAGYMKDLFDVIDIMRSPPQKKFKKGVLEKWDPRLEPDLVVFNSVLNACVKRKQWQGAFWVLQQIKQQGQQPSGTTYGLVMEVMYACGKYSLVHEFFRRAQKSSMPNALTYKVLVNTLWREGKANEAVLAVKEMEKRGIVGSAALYYDLARCLCSVGRCDEALMQVEKICKVANKPLVVTYTGLVQASLATGDIQSGKYIFQHMQKFCDPNLVTYNIMIKAFVEHGRLEEAKELFQKMLGDENHLRSGSDIKGKAVPDIYTYNTILDACAAEKKWDDFQYVYVKMLNHGYHFNVKRHLRMLLDASRAGKVDVLETTWKHLSQENRAIPLPVIIERFCSETEKGEYGAAISCMTAHSFGELRAFSKKAWLNLLKENIHRFGIEGLGAIIDRLNVLFARNDPPNPVLQNLVISCKEFYRTQTHREVDTVPEDASSVESETANILLGSQAMNCV